MIEALEDQVELNSLIMVANKRKYLDRAQRLSDNFVVDQAQYQFEAASESNGVPATAATPGTSALATEDDGSIVNRSPTTNYHIYQTAQPEQKPAPQPQPTPVPTPTPTPSTGSKLPKWLLPVGLALLLASGAGGLAWWLATRPTPPSNSTKPPTYSPDTTIEFS